MTANMKTMFGTDFFEEEEEVEGDDEADNEYSQVAREIAMQSALRTFYQQHKPTHANDATINKLLAKYKGREHKLHKKLQGVYGSAPDELLAAKQKRKARGGFGRDGFGGE